jgi:hypothetical protein
MRYDFDGYGYKYIDNGSGSDWRTRIKDAEPLYTSPQRTWIGLTDEDMGFLFPHGKSVWVQEIVKIIENKLKEKNT